MYAIVRIDGFDEHIVSRHRKVSTAEKQLRKYNGSCRYVIRDLDKYEVIDLFGKKTLRPKM
jgi:hypothetical protein